jgi:hypothetical protein
MKRLLVIGALALASALAGCGGSDEKATTKPATRQDAPPTAPSQFPPKFVKCMADQGVDVQSPADFHSSPKAQQAFPACAELLHAGGTP